jgi:hypothetical protein
MRLIIELTNGRKDACGDCECVAEMLAGVERSHLEKVYKRRIATYYFEE